MDHDVYAHEAYTASFPHPAHRWNLSSVTASKLASFQADLWWMSPPCQPFTVRGRRRDVDDPRCAAFLHLLEVLMEVQPEGLALENVPGFAGSRAHARLRAVLQRLAYAVTELEACPTQLGIPNRRRRFYLLARRAGPAPVVNLRRRAQRSLADALDEEVSPELYVEEALQRRYAGNLAVVEASDPGAVAHCFTSAYGRSPVYAGSYLRDARGLRRFSPSEILRLLGFRHVCLPHTWTLQRGWKMAGNSLSVDVVRELLQAMDPS